MADTKTSDISVPKHRKDVQASYLGLARETRQRILKYTVEASLSTSTWRSDHQDCFKFLDNLRCTHDSVKNDLSLPLKQVSNDLRAKIIKDERLFQWVMDLDVGKLDPTKVEIKEFENQGDIDEDELDSAIAAKKSAKEVIDFWICGSKGHPKKLGQLANHKWGNIRTGLWGELDQDRAWGRPIAEMVPCATLA